MLNKEIQLWMEQVLYFWSRGNVKDAWAHSNMIVKSL